MDLESILMMCSNDQLDQVIQECHLFRTGFYSDKDELTRAIRNIIYEQ